MQNIILTGPKHSGKTSAGRILASLCSCEFIDIDDLITQRTGKSPRQIYAGSPDDFLKAEAEAAASIVISDKAKVIAAGGGIIDNPKAIDSLKELGVIFIYLAISAGCAWNRIAGNELPAFLKTENPEETHRVLHKRRSAAYQQNADITVDAEGKTPDEIAAEIKGLIPLK